MLACVTIGLPDILSCICTSCELHLTTLQLAVSMPPDAVNPVLNLHAVVTHRRQCVGMALAKMNYTAVLAHLLGKFSFSLAPRMGGADGVLRAQKYEVLLTPSTGMWMHCQPRAT